MSNTPTEIKLHVVFAGRGDALIVEYKINNRRVIIVVDGGPLMRYHVGGGGSKKGKKKHWRKKTTQVLQPKKDNSGAAPFRGYLMAALRSIWGNDPTLRIDRIINSHPDDDHYGGLLELIGKNVKRKKQFVLDGGFYVPYYPSEVSFQQITSFLKEHNLFASHARDITFGGLTGMEVHFPTTPASLIKFHASGDGVVSPASKIGPKTGIRVIGNITEVRDKNDSSILMSIANSIFFTGDGSADRIQPFVIDKNFAIYKVPHHGAWLHNNNIWETTSNAPAGVANEYLLYYLLKWTDSEWIPPYVDRNNLNRPALYVFANRLVSILNGMGVSRADMIELLETRQCAYRDEVLLYPLSPVPESNVAVPKFNTTNGLAGMVTVNISNLISQLFREIDQSIAPGGTAFKTTKPAWMNYLTYNVNYGDYVQIKNGEIERVSWFSDYSTLPTYWRFKYLNLYGKVMQFFSTFKADAYVISGSAIAHGHPTVVILMGIALAVRAKKRKATLFVTDPGKLFARENWAGAVGVDPDLLIAATWCNMDADELFAGDNLHVRYLSKHSFVSIDAEKWTGGNTVPGAQRDLNNATDEISQFIDATHHRKIHDHLVQSAHVLPITNTDLPSSKKWLVKVQLNATKHNYMTIENKGTSGVQVAFVLSRKEVYIKELKSTFGVGNIGGRGATIKSGFMIEVSNNRNFNPSIRLVLNQLGTVKGEWQLFNDELEYTCVKHGAKPAMRLCIEGKPILAIIIQESLVGVDSIMASSSVVSSSMARSSMAGNFLSRSMSKQDLIISSRPMEVIQEIQEIPHEGNKDDLTVEEIAGLDSTAREAVSDDFQVNESAEPGFQENNAPSDFNNHFNNSSDEINNEATETQAAVEDNNRGLFGREIFDELETETTTSLSFLEYLDKVGFHQKDIITNLDALTALVGKANNPLQTITNLTIFSKLLSTAIDPDKSTFNYSSDASTGYSFERATMLAKLAKESSTGLKFKLGDDELEAQTITFNILRKAFELTIAVGVTTTDSLLFALSKKLILPKKTPNLRDFFVAAGVEAEKSRDLSVVSIFAFIFGNSDKAAQLFCGMMPTKLLDAGLALLKPNLDLSEAEIENSPTGTKRLTNLYLPCDVPLIGANMQIDLSVIKIKIVDVAFELDDINTADEMVSFTAGAEITAGNEPGSGNGVKLQVRFDMTDALSEIHFAAIKLKSITELAGPLSLTMDELQKLPVPFTKAKGENPSPASSGDLASLKSSAVGFSIREAGKGSSKFDLSTVFVEVDFQDFQEWKEFLPEKFLPSSIDNAKIRVTIFKPLLSSRQVQVEVAFHVNITTEKDNNTIDSGRQYIDAEFSARPMGLLSDYEFRLNLSSEAGISAVDLGSLTGLDLGKNMKSSMPLIYITS